MNKNLELLLQLEELALLRRGLQQAGPLAEEADPAELNDRINRLRRKLPGPVLSEFDRLARRYANIVTVVANNICQGCQEELSPRLARQVAHAHQLAQCEHCGRFLILQENAPDYISAG